MGGGTEAFPDLGQHCQHPDCHQLDFLPFKCDGCRKVFCLDHRSYKKHECPKSDHNSRKVVVCENCSMSIETTGQDGEDEKVMLERHEKSGSCDPKKKNKPTCPVRRCKEILTFSNTNTCKICQVKVCLKHRFPVDHACKQARASSGPWNGKFLAALASRNAGDCARTGRGSPSSSSSTPSSVKAY
ncbi:zinc finger AN1 domain-containing stress-associated protein 12 isoform X1 [Juglans microcarpa x Juglans regia]|uniref:zinc finger AN1 domain-containing stress-associated protein 12 isoform X1 n=1 Tax=Juglans microcarpa x Juglans regia TaxID=2249226 RepID=UPI001B7E6210|nr:zinc finger AN1 domain-containing stress-associated protein 12 isoform X1 [Juglans microcarpa x Juglans regia]